MLLGLQQARILISKNNNNTLYTSICKVWSETIILLILRIKLCAPFTVHDSVPGNMAESSSKSFAIGIDLGTTYSCAAIFQDDNLITIENDLGDRTTASWVSFTEHECIVGNAARAACCNPSNMIYDAKRMIGRQFSDSMVQEDAKHWPFKVVNVATKPKVQVECKGDKQLLTPEEISSKVLRYLKECAELKLGEEVTRAVVTIPAYFNNSQRQATMDAAQLAGLKVLRLLSEPFAAAMAYGLGMKYQFTGNILVYDLGGGTFDVSILKVDGGLFDVKSTNGNTHLGGEDFTNRLVNYAIAEFKAKGIEVSDNKKPKLREQCEKVKRMFTARTHCDIEYQDTNINVSRACFDELNHDLFASTIECVRIALSDAKLKTSDIQEVVMTGGSTRILKIKQMVQDFFDGKKLTMSINADDAVAHGAAIQAAILTGDTSPKLKDLVLSDVTPLSLGVETNAGVMTIVVKRNSRIPLSVTHNFTTRDDNQTSVKFSVYEGERAEVKDNTFLDAFVLAPIPPALRGVPSLVTNFNISSDGILTVTATEKATGQCNKVVIKKEGRMTAVEIDQCVEESKRMKAIDDETRLKQEARNNLESLAHTIKHKFEGSVAAHSSRKELVDKCNSVLTWLKQSELMDKSVCEEKHKELDRMQKKSN